MCYVCCKELKGWCNSFTRAEGLLSLLEAIFLVVFFSFFIFLILHFVACPTYPEGITEEHPKITEATTSTIVVVTTASYPPITGAFTGAESSSSTGSTSTLPPDVECTWEASRQTSAGTHYYLTTEPRSSRRQTDTPSTRRWNDEPLELTAHGAHRPTPTVAGSRLSTLGARGVLLVQYSGWDERCYSQSLRRLLLEHDCFAEGGNGFPFPLAPDYGLNQGRTRKVATAYCLDDNMAVPFPGSAHLDCVLHRVLRAVRMVVK